MLLFLCSLAFADEPDDTTGEDDSDDGGWIDLDAEADFGSALDRQPSDATGSPLRGRFALRPVLGVQELDGAWGGNAGGTISHQWWSLRPRRLAPVGETRLRLAGSFGGLRGHELALESTHGAWLGPPDGESGPSIGLLLGPELRQDRLSSDETALTSAWTLGPQARLALRLGPLTPWAAVTPTWTLHGDRADLDAPWDGLSLAAGLAMDGRPIGIRLAYRQHESGEATARELALGLHLRLL